MKDLIHKQRHITFYEKLMRYESHLDHAYTSGYKRETCDKLPKKKSVHHLFTDKHSRIIKVLGENCITVLPHLS